MKAPEPEASGRRSALGRIGFSAQQLSTLGAITTSDFSRKVGQTVGTRVVTIAAGSATTIVVARLLGPEGRGQYAVAGAIGAVGVSFANAGLQAANTYFVSRDRTLLGPLIGNSVAVGVGGATLLAALAGLGLGLSGRIELSTPLLVLAVAAVPIGLAYLLLQNLLIGLREIATYNLIEIGSRFPGLILLGLVVLLHATDVSSVFAASLAGSVVAAAWAYRRLVRALGARPTVSRPLFLQTMRYGARAYLAALFAFLLLRSDIFIVRYDLGTTQAGLYSIAVSLADLLYVVPTVVGTILFPRLSTMDDPAREWQTSLRVAGAVLIFMSVLAAAIWPSSHLVVTLLFGHDFSHAARSFGLLAIAMIFYGVNNVISNFAAARGFPAFAIWIWAVALAVNVGLNLLFVPRFGISGSAFASLLCYAIVALAQLVYFMRRADARPA